MRHSAEMLELAIRVRSFFIARFIWPVPGILGLIAFPCVCKYFTNDTLYWPGSGQMNLIIPYSITVRKVWKMRFTNSKDGEM